MAKQQSRKQTLLERELELQDIKRVASTPEGFRLLVRFLSIRPILDSTFNPNNSIMSFQEGGRVLSSFIERELREACPEIYLEMVRLDKPQSKGVNDAKHENDVEAAPGESSPVPDIPGAGE